MKIGVRKFLHQSHSTALHHNHKKNSNTSPRPQLHPLIDIRHHSEANKTRNPAPSHRSLHSYSDPLVQPSPTECVTGATHRARDCPRRPRRPPPDVVEIQPSSKPLRLIAVDEHRVELLPRIFNLRHWLLTSACACLPDGTIFYESWTP